MRSRLILIISVGVVALILLSGSFSAGILLGRFIPVDGRTPVERLPFPLFDSTPTSPEPSNDSTQPAELSDLFDPFWQTWEIIHDQYVDQPVDDEALMRGAIKGMLESLGDRHSSYMDPQQYIQAAIPIEGTYEGIGAWVDPTAEYLTIVSPMQNSPAEEAGLRPGDQIIAVDGEDMSGVDGSLVINRVMGPAGTVVQLTIQRPGVAQPFDVEVRRARITVPSVESEMLENDVAYVHLITFGDTTTRDLRRALRDLLEQNPQGLILDLRNNGGGTLRTAIEVASQFIADGVIMYEEFGDGSRETFTAIRGGEATEIPLVLLINEGSASASEIVVGAIQDHNRGLVVGTTSFGKGSVQNWIPLSNEQGAVRITIARWTTPGGRTIHEVGLEPDLLIEFTEEDFEAGRDPQLDKAIEIILEQ